MVAQTVNLFSGQEGFEEAEALALALKGKRNRTTRPDFVKVYTTDKFDDELYHQLSIDIVDKPVFPYSLMFYAKTSINLFVCYYLKMINKWTRFDVAKYHKLCFYLDEEGKRISKGDEKHIFRYPTLHKVYTKLYFEMKFDAEVTESLVKRLKFSKDLTLQETAILCRIEQLENWGIRLHFDEEFGNQAEIIGTEMLPLGERLKKHIKLLKLLKRKLNEFI